MEVYDDLTFWLLNLAVVVQILMSWLFLKKENRKQSIFTCALHVFENVLHLPLNRTIMPKELSGRTIMTFFTFYNLALNLLYMSTIISLLINGSPPPEINSLSDLNKEIFQDVRIIMKRRSFVPTFLKSSGMLDGFEQRVDYIDVHYGGDTIDKVRDGSHVFLTPHGNFYSFLCKTNKAGNKTAAELDDFRKSRQGSAHPCQIRI